MSAAKQQPTMGGLNLDPPDEVPTQATPVDPRSLRSSVDGLANDDLRRRVEESTRHRLPSMAPVKRQRRERLVALSAMVPPYVRDALTQRAAADKTTKTFLMLRALRAVGIEVRDEDLIEDGRSPSGRR